MSSYRLRRKESVEQSVKRVLEELAGDALAMLQDPGAQGIEQSVHETRKRCKMARGLVRLVRPALGKEYAVTNRLFRDAARALDPIRDPHAILAIFDDLVASARQDLPSGGLLQMRSALAGRAAEATERLSGAERNRLDQAAELIEAARARSPAWDLPDGFDALSGGLAITYKRGRKAMAEAAGQRSAEAFHEWRKRVKYLWYHVRLLGKSAPVVLDPLAGSLHDLSDSLGDAHDLALMVDLAGDLHVGPEQHQTLQVIAGTTRADLEKRSLRLGRRLYVESPKAFGKRLRGYWQAWQDAPEKDAGEIAELFPPTDDLGERTRQELYRLARDLEVPGRFGMDKLELVSALRSAGVR